MYQCGIINVNCKIERDERATWRIRPAGKPLYRLRIPSSRTIVLTNGTNRSLWLSAETDARFILVKVARTQFLTGTELASFICSPEIADAMLAVGTCT
jgi:hypothetical protein